MFDKLLLRNDGGEFKITFDGIEHTVPAGKFEAEANLWYFIVSTAAKWWIPLVRVSEPLAPGIVRKNDPIVSKNTEIVENLSDVVSNEETIDEPVVEETVDAPKMKKSTKK